MEWVSEQRAHSIGLAAAAVLVAPLVRVLSSAISSTMCRVKFCEPRDSAFSRRQAASAAAKCAVSPCPDAQGLSLSLTLTLNLTLNLALISRAALRTEASSRGGCSSSCSSSCGRRADH